MKKYSILLILALLLTSACNRKPDKEQYINQIPEIENGLLPMIIIDGEETESFNIHDRMKYYNVPGISIAFMDKGEILWSKGYGYTSFDSIKPVDENTLFQAASISKPVAAMAALYMVEQGKLGLDDNVNDYLIDWQVEENEFTVDEKATLRRLLSHSAGLTVHGFAGYARNDTVPDIIQVLNGEEPANSGRIYPDVLPGSIYRYSGGGYTVMQKMLCDITGKDFPDIMDEYVLGVLGMESSTYMQPLPEDMEKMAAVAHSGDGSMVEGKWHTYPEMAAAGLWTTPTDLLKYALEVQKSLYGKSNLILSGKMTREMLTPQINSHGLGPGVRGKNLSASFGHGGANAGYRCQLYAFSHGGQGVALMTNSDRGDVLIGEILRSFSNLYGWDEFKPLAKTIIEVDKERLNELAGDYSLTRPDQDLVITFSSKDNHLEGLQLWDDFSFEIYPEDTDMFFNKEDRTSFDFVRDAGGNIEKVIIGEQWHFLRQYERK